MDALFKTIYDDLIKQEDAKGLEQDKKYHKVEGYRALGIKAPVLDKLLKKYKPDIKKLSCTEALVLARKLFKTKTEEMISAGSFVLQQKLECIGASELSMLDEALDYFCSWSTTDDFCIYVLRPLLLEHKKEMLALLKKWNVSKNIWKRRASVVIFVRKIGESGKFTREALALCENLLDDKEDLVQKGVGWCLKDIMRGDKTRVLEYIKKLRRLGVSSTITLYAIRDLKGGEREDMLSVAKAQ